jgi:molybdenum cofactor guanylyltransferase
MSATKGSNIGPQVIAAGYVMAGGASERFGFDKARAELSGETMLQRMGRLVASAAGSVKVVAPADRYNDFDFWIVEDLWPGQGPLGGIITALMATGDSAHRCHWNLIVSCDMPFLAVEWLAYLVAHALESSGTVVVPRSARGLEPLCACWRTSAVTKLQYAFEDGVRKVTEAMKRLDVEVLDDSHWKRFDSAGRLFWNMNTPQDYENARRILEQELE